MKVARLASPILGQRTRLLPALLAASVAANCSVAERESGATTSTATNACSHDSDCLLAAGGGFCGPGLCLTSRGELSRIFVEAVPSATSVFGAGESFLIPMDQIEQGGQRDIVLPYYAGVTGKWSVPASLSNLVESVCPNEFDSSSASVGFHVGLSYTGSQRGLPTVSSEAVAVNSNSGWFFHLYVPPGTYDALFTPFGNCASVLPPVLLRGVDLTTGEIRLDLSAAIRDLTGTVVPPPSQPLPDWTVDILEPSLGRTISTRRSLGESVPTNFQIWHSGGTGERLLLRLSPPDTIAAPTLYWDLALLDLDGDRKVSLDLSQLQRTPHIVRGRILTSDGHPLALADVRLKSAQLDEVPQGIIATYQTILQTDIRGEFVADLPAGSYHALVIPPADSGHALDMVVWSLGRSTTDFEYPMRPATYVTGLLSAPGDTAPLDHVEVSASPSWTVRPDFASSLFGGLPVYARARSAWSEADGSFSLLADSNPIDLVIKPASSSGFSWRLLPRLTSTEQSLGVFEVQYPVLVSGKVRAPQTSVVMKNAALRAYALVHQSTGEFQSEMGKDSIAVLVAEARSDDEGSFTLLLPPSIH